MNIHTDVQVTSFVEPALIVQAVISGLTPTPTMINCLSVSVAARFLSSGIVLCCNIIVLIMIDK